MTLRPCIVAGCGEPTEQSRCPEHRTDHKSGARTRGYTASWDRLSKRARRLQPFCSDCGATEDLQTDHTPEAWAAHNAGKPINLAMVDVVCGPCNRTRGAARGNTMTRGDTPPAPATDPPASRNARYIPPGGIR